MKIDLPLTLIALTACSLLQGQPVVPENEKSIWDTEYKWTQASLKGDAKLRSEIELKGYSLTELNGDVKTREDEIEELTSGRIVYKSFSSHELSLKNFENTAIITGRIAAQLVVDGKPLEGIFAFTDTLIKTNGVWKKAATHLSQIGTSSKLALEPVPREAKWVRRHESFVKLANKENPEIMFLGDSITDLWRNPDRGATVLKKHWPDTSIINLGISGDRTQHVLWRLINGEIGNQHPKAIMLMIGTNNLGIERDGITPRNTPEETAEGIKAIVELLRSKLPQSKILLLAVFPRSHLPTDEIRLQVNEVNKQISKLADDKFVTYLDIGSLFLTQDAVLDKSMMADYLHPTTAGYEIWAKAVEGKLAELIK